MTATRMGKSSKRYRSRDEDSSMKLSSKRRRLMRYDEDGDNGYDKKGCMDSFPYDKHSERCVFSSIINLKQLMVAYCCSEQIVKLNFC